MYHKKEHGFESTRQSIELAHYLRAASGCKNIIESNFQQRVYEDNHQLDEFFGHDNILFVEEDKKKNATRRFTEHAIITKDLTGLIDRVLIERKVRKDDVLIKIGLDGGGGFLKICMSIFDLQSPVPLPTTLSKNFKNSGVKKVFLIAIIPGVPEDFVNIKNVG